MNDNELNLFAEQLWKGMSKANPVTFCLSCGIWTRKLRPQWDRLAEAIARCAGADYELVCGDRNSGRYALIKRKAATQIEDQREDQREDER